MAIGENIKRRRKELDMTLEEVAARVGVSRQTLSRYETGVIGNIPSDKIELLADALRTTPAYIMGWDDKEQSSHTDLSEYLEILRTRPEARALLKTVHGATKEEVERNVKFIEALRKADEDAD